MAFKIRTGSRKENLKHPDAFVGTMERLQDWLAHNTRGIVVFLVILAVAGAAAGGWLFYNKKQEEAASVLEFEARQHFHQEGPALDENLDATPEENYQAAVKRYREIIEQFPRTSTALMARYYLGNAYMGLEDYDQAILAYQEFLSNDKGNAVLRGLVFQRLGYAYLAKGRRDEAVETFKSGLQTDGALNKDQIYYELGHLYHNEGNAEEAIRNYQGVVNEFPDSQFLVDAQSHLRELGVTEVKKEPGDPEPGVQGRETSHEEQPVKTAPAPPAEK